MLSRQQYVDICNTCVKRQFNKDKGVVCSLTGEHAAFDTTCPDLEVDPLAIKRIERMEKHSQEMGNRQMGRKNTSESKGAFSMEEDMMKSGVGGGILMIIGGVVWLFVGLQFDWIFFYPFFLIIGGIVVLVKGMAKKAQEIQKPDTSGILDDKDDMEIF